MLDTGYESMKGQAHCTLVKGGSQKQIWSKVCKFEGTLQNFRPNSLFTVKPYEIKDVAHSKQVAQNIWLNISWQEAIFSSKLAISRKLQ